MGIGSGKTGVKLVSNFITAKGVSKVISPADFADVADFYVEIFEKNLRYLRNPREMKFNWVAII